MGDSLQNELDYYLSNKEKILKEYKNCFVAIKENKIIGYGKNKVDTVNQMIKEGYSLGTFLVHFVSEEPELIQRFYSRIV